jgi:hypothetical protein
MYEGYETVYVVQLFGAPAAKPVVKTVVQAPTPIPTPEPAPVVAETEPEVPAVAGSEIEVPEPVEVTGIEEVPTTTEESEIVVVPAPTETTSPADEDVVVVEKEMVATSSGLAVANITEPPSKDSVGPAGLATEPSKLLQIAYVLFGFIVVGLLLASVVLEARRNHYRQVAYGFGLLAIMGGLWYVHNLLTAGAVIL